MARTWTSPNNIVAAHGAHTPSRAIKDAKIIARFHRQLEDVKIGLFDDNNDNDAAAVSFDNDDIKIDPYNTYPAKVSAAKREAVFKTIRADAAKKRKMVHEKHLEEIEQLKEENTQLKDENASLKEGFNKNKKLVEVMQVELQKAKEEKGKEHV